MEMLTHRCCNARRARPQDELDAERSGNEAAAEALAGAEAQLGELSDKLAATEDYAAELKDELVCCNEEVRAVLCRVLRRSGASASSQCMCMG